MAISLRHPVHQDDISLGTPSTAVDSTGKRKHMLSSSGPTPPPKWLHHTESSPSLTSPLQSLGRTLSYIDLSLTGPLYGTHTHRACAIDIPRLASILLSVNGTRTAKERGPPPPHPASSPATRLTHPLHTAVALLLFAVVTPTSESFPELVRCALRPPPLLRAPMLSRPQRAPFRSSSSAAAIASSTTAKRLNATNGKKPREPNLPRLAVIACMRASPAGAKILLMGAQLAVQMMRATRQLEAMCATPTPTNLTPNPSAFDMEAAASSSFELKAQETKGIVEEAGTDREESEEVEGAHGGIVASGAAIELDADGDDIDSMLDTPEELAVLVGKRVGRVIVPAPRAARAVRRARTCPFPTRYRRTRSGALWIVEEVLTPVAWEGQMPRETPGEDWEVVEGV
ncbi:hypothetical protein DFH08DRAFT_798935 [Mycena albidolilacea]|uniref:Uncharacterized protein n=1 Tax=Mycena albidolilacea TaxID=1033008 RepID=A0AAD7APL5_9AGAR|nr:hypothetical protein DFH08DRAFT_798935 [Mycena albidolilacea]